MADAWGPVVKRLARCGCVRRVMADGRVRLVSGCARAGGDAGPASWATRVKGQARLGWASWACQGRLARKAKQAWAAASPSFSFSFSVRFSFLSFVSIQI